MRKKDKGLLEILTVAPWWVGVTVAMFSFIFLRFILPLIDFENLLLNGILHNPQISWFSLIFLGPAAVSATNSFRKRRLLDRQSGIESIRNLSWQEFEELLGEAYRR
ncbi:hypothetical protein LLG95_15085 [bacterium]|nr:hypothetical protein [bacterium]